LKDQRMYLLDVFRRKLDFPDLKRFVRQLADLHHAKIVLVEDKASGTSLIQELRADNFSRLQAAPEIDGDKIMRLRAQTAKIAGGFVFFPKEAAWLDTYVHELVSFPNAKNDDQVDSTVFALAWSTLHGMKPYLLQYYNNEASQLTSKKANQNGMIRVRVAPGPTHWQLSTGTVLIPPDRILEVPEIDAAAIRRNGGELVD